MVQNMQTEDNARGNDSLVLTAKETSNLLRISKTTVYELIRQGVIPSIRFGKRILIPRAALMHKLEDVNEKPIV
jgi:excisionase family DNA binding protein